MKGMKSKIKRVKIFGVSGIDTHEPLEFRKAVSGEGLIGRSGYYFLYEPQNITSDLILLKREGKRWTCLGVSAVDLTGPQNLKMSIVGSVIKAWKVGGTPIIVTDTSFSYGAFGGVVRWERVASLRIPVKKLKV